MRETIDLPLHTGKAPRWLFERMSSLGGEIVEAIVIERGRDYLFSCLSSPLWFQSLGCLLGFDWHSSGLTTTLCAALKEGLKNKKDIGIYICGGKGKTSRKTPQQIEEICSKKGINPEDLINFSRLTAKIDNNCLQDGFNLYHHCFIFSPNKDWLVIQQGMSNNNEGFSRRYHWYSKDFKSFISQPHSGIISSSHFFTLNLVDAGIEKTQDLITELAQREPTKNIKEFNSLANKSFKLPSRHKILIEDINPKFLEKIFLKTYERKPKNFLSLINEPGVGQKTLRALALVAELIYGSKNSFSDPARFSFAHGGKDGYPYPVDKTDYDETITILKKCIHKARILYTDKVKIFKKLHQFYS